MHVEWVNVHPEVTHPGMWDDTFLRELLNGDFGPVPDGKIAVIPGRYHTGDITRVSDLVAGSDLVVVTADEANEFPLDRLRFDGPIWVQTLRPGRYQRQVTAFPLGYPPDTRTWVHDSGFPPATPSVPAWFAGQVTHPRRHALVAALEGEASVTLQLTEGFTQGLDRRVYLERMADTMVALCPSGPETQDTFRLWEALQAGAVPIADASTPLRVDDGYWHQLFDGEVPFPVVHDWHTAPVHSLVEGWPHTSNMIQAWWTRWRRSWASRLADVLPSTVFPDLEDLVTVLIPTSPIPTHPDAALIETTVESIRDRLPTADLRIMVDGIRPEQWHSAESFQEYTRRLLWLASNRWYNVTVTVHETHMHQAAMTRHELDTVETPLLLFVEHDTPLMGDWPIAQLLPPLLDGYTADVIRLNHDWRIHPEHEYLLADSAPTTLEGLPLRRTRQWSQRPHFARTDRYRTWLDTYFQPSERFMIEDRMHSVLQRQAWGKHRVWIWTPDGNQQRSYHLDGRGGDTKWVDH